MATTTTNNAWAIPQSTDLVTNGATAIATLGSAIDTSVGTGLKAWTAFTPTISGGWAVGNGTWVAYYSQLGKNVDAYGEFTVGSTTTKGTGLTISLPPSLPVRVNQNQSWFTSMLAAGTGNWKGSWRLASTTTMTLTTLFVSGTGIGEASITSTVPATWATGDKVRFQINYETA